jgi:hypothetical protein
MKICSESHCPCCGIPMTEKGPLHTVRPDCVQSESVIVVGSRHKLYWICERCGCRFPHRENSRQQPATANWALTQPVTLAGIPLGPCVCGGCPVVEDHRIVCSNRWAGGALLCSRAVTWSEAGSERTAAETWNGQWEAAP